MTYAEALKIALNIKLTISDSHKHAVTVIHEEGTVLHYQSAIARQLEDGWIAVLPEHHTPTVYHEDDASVYLFERIWEIPINKKQ